MTEADAMRNRYERRKTAVEADRYNPLRPDVWQRMQERQRELLLLFSGMGVRSFEGLSLTEVGCGVGSNLLEFLRLGFQPENLTGLELLEERVVAANRYLPGGIVRTADATKSKLEAASQDIVFQSVVFSSILDDTYQEELASRMWEWVKPGGGVLWYDFIFHNPNNRDVRGVPLRRVRALFPKGRFTVRRLTLAPPLARVACRIHPALYSIVNACPFLRTHTLCWIGKD
jgi:2-polyprenyl-3-methyl-5-hydroxy-6-metoxy-1,4-benzoquinol methylase